MKPVGLTAFHKPLVLVKELIERIRKNRPDSIFSMIFLTDGWNNNCPWGCPFNEFHENYEYRRGSLPKLDELFITTIGFNIPSLLSENQENAINELLSVMYHELIEPKL